MTHTYTMSKSTIPSGTAGTGRGSNTKPLSSRKKKHRAYCLTLNNYSPEELEHWNRHFNHCGKNWIIGKEVGEDEKTPHLQAYIQYKSARSFDKMKVLFPKAHIEAAKGNLKDNYEYCIKDGDFTTNMNFESMRDKLSRICLSEYSTVVWLPWQRRILDILDSEHVCDRKIFWFWEKKGNVGKSFLCKYIAIRYEVVICDGKKDNIFNQVNMMIDADKQPKIILLDIPRSCVDFVNYGAIEQMKNGMMYSGKYEGGVCIFPIPHVICFANTRPHTNEMSKDRWVIEKIVSK